MQFIPRIAEKHVRGTTKINTESHERLNPRIWQTFESWVVSKVICIQTYRNDLCI